jgi:uncharacterized protein YecT (DUF1311 family)
MIHALALAVVAASGAAAQDGAAQDRAAPPVAAVGACLDAAERDPEAERACIGAPALACIDADPAAETTVGMTACYAAEADAWDAILNATYAEIVALSAALAAADAAAGGAPIDQEALLRTAQRAWVAFRDADCAQEAAHWGEGSMRQVAGAQCLMARTATRTLELLAKRRVFENP